MRIFSFWRGRDAQVDAEVRAGESRATVDHLPLFSQLRPLFEAELRRARRYERPLSLLILFLEPVLRPVGESVVLAPDPWSAHATRAQHWRRSNLGASVSRPGVPQHQANLTSDHAQRFVQLGELLQDALRETDLVGLLDNTREFAALLPEADALAAEQASGRILQLWAGREAVSLQIGAATYPAGGLMLEDLLNSARQALHPVVRARDQASGHGKDAARA